MPASTSRPAVAPITRAVLTNRMLSGIGFLLAASLCALLLPSGHSFSAAGPAAAILFIISTRFSLRVTSTGWVGCQQAAFVFLLFALPLNVVPLVAVLCLAAGQQRVRGNRAFRFLGAAENSWYALPAPALLAVLAPGDADWRHWPAYAAAFASQFVVSTVASMLRGRVIDEPLDSRDTLDAIVVDVALTPIGLAAAVALVRAPGGALAAMAGLAAVLAIASHEHSERQANEARALRDPLTRLANRALFDEVAEACEARCHRTQTDAGLLLIDLDEFKPINDTLGHQAGDQVLQIFADALRSTTRAVDLAARLGGDEFAVILSEPIQLDGIRQIAEALRQRFAEPVSIDGNGAVKVRFSFGYAVFGTGGSLAKAMSAADAALYADKRTRKQRLS